MWSFVLGIWGDRFEEWDTIKSLFQGSINIGGVLNDFLYTFVLTWYECDQLGFDSWLYPKSFTSLV